MAKAAKALRRAHATRKPAKSGLDWIGIRARIEEIAHTLEIPNAEVDRALRGDDQSLLNFCYRLGDPRQGRRHDPRASRKMGALMASTEKMPQGRRSDL
jgi:hypothetical protein